MRRPSDIAACNKYHLLWSNIIVPTRLSRHDVKDLTKCDILEMNVDCSVMVRDFLKGVIRSPALSRFFSTQLNTERSAFVSSVTAHSLEHVIKLANYVTMHLDFSEFGI